MRAAVLLVLYILIVIAVTPIVLACLITGMREPLMLIGKGAMAVGRAILGIKLEVKGLDLLEREKAYLFMANHESFLDGPLLFYVIPRLPRVILKKSVFRIPVLGQGMRHVGFVPVDRKGVRGGKASIDLASRLIRERGYSFLIFPEGTRSLDGRIQAFRRGGFFLALPAGRRSSRFPSTARSSSCPRAALRSGRGALAFYSIRPSPRTDMIAATWRASWRR